MPPKSSGKAKAANGAERVSSGVPGLDALIGGGFVPNDVYLITGGTGTGKTLFCCQFLWEGLQKGENGLFFSMEERAEDVISDAEVFGWNFSKYIDEGKCAIQYHDPVEMADITTEVKNIIKKYDARRVVIDSTSIFGMVFENEHEMRKKLYELIKALKDTGCVVLLTAEILEDSKALSRYGVEEFVVDGVIVLYYVGIGGEEGSSLQVRKMRRTNHAKGYFQMEFTKNGLAVKGEGISVLMK